jgi:hypothetical protein
MDVTAGAPNGDDVGGLPVIVFSHGFHGCATQSRFLMEAFAFRRVPGARPKPSGCHQ